MMIIQRMPVLISNSYAHSVTRSGGEVVCVAGGMASVTPPLLSSISPRTVGYLASEIL